MCVVKPIRMEFPEESEIAEIDLVEGLKSTIIIVDNIVLQFFLLDKMFLLINSFDKKLLTSCIIHPAKCIEMTMIKNFNQEKYLWQDVNNR